MQKILITDDNKQITSILTEYAKKEGFEPIIAYDGEDALLKFKNNDFSIVLLDVMMPKKDGFEVCREIRKTSQVPIIIITARGEDFEKIMGLEIGADDYIVKPFSPLEVMARIKAILRRTVKNDKENDSVNYDNLKINMSDYTVMVEHEYIELTKKEIEILFLLVSHRNRVYSRENLLNQIWGYDYYGDSRTVDSHIKRLRSKLEKYHHPNWEIKTVWGVGYKFEVNEDV